MTRIALVLGGGVSLGSYIAGAVTELFTALERNRTGAPVSIDVITGASAGALTGALAARALRVNRNLLPWIGRAWVEAADIETLLDPGRPDSSSWLDASVIEDLTQVLVSGEPAADDEPSSFVGDPLLVGFTLANLHGVRYDFRYGFLNVPDRRFGTRVHADRIDFELTPAHPAGDPIWEDVRQAALASASFPFAFPPRRLRRSASDYPGARLADDEREIDMWYVDGGVFDNAPLGLAKDLAERHPAYRGADWRYIMVEPTLRSSAAAEEPPAGSPSSLFDLAGTLAGAVLGQGAAKDWLTANRVNERLEILQAIVDRLPDLHTELADPTAVALGRYIGELAESVAEVQVAATRGDVAEAADPVVDLLDRNLERIELDPRYASALDRIDSRAGRVRLAKLIFALEAACGLLGKDFLALYLVAPERAGQLSGDFLGNFGGFLCHEWRENDFRAGRRDARRMLQTSLSDVIHYEPDQAAAYRVEPMEATFDSIPAAARRRLERGVEAEADRLLAEVRPGAIAGAFGWLWKPVVRRWLAERTLRALRTAR